MLKDIEVQVQQDTVDDLGAPMVENVETVGFKDVDSANEYAAQKIKKGFKAIVTGCENGVMKIV